MRHGRRTGRGSGARVSGLQLHANLKLGYHQHQHIKLYNIVWCMAPTDILSPFISISSRISRSRARSLSLVHVPCVLRGAISMRSLVASNRHSLLALARHVHHVMLARCAAAGVLGYCDCDCGSRGHMKQDTRHKQQKRRTSA